MAADSCSAQERENTLRNKLDFEDKLAEAVSERNSLRMQLGGYPSLHQHFFTTHSTLQAHTQSLGIATDQSIADASLALVRRKHGNRHMSVHALSCVHGSCQAAARSSCRQGRLWS
jgi:hypothetical protein